jgi:acyl carrier protein
MTADTVYEKMNLIFRDVFEDDSLVVGAETSAIDIPDWDSLTHVNLVVAVEKEFKIRFTTKEIRSLQNLGEWVTTICSKLG